LADRLEEIAELLEAQEANPYRAQAYRSMNERTSARTGHTFITAFTRPRRMARTSRSWSSVVWSA
jgi:hypothetical protein